MRTSSQPRIKTLFFLLFVLVAVFPSAVMITFPLKDYYMTGVDVYKKLENQE